MKEKSLYKELKEIFENKNIIEVKVIEEVKGGVISTYKGIKLFIPASHISLTRIEDFKKL